MKGGLPWQKFLSAETGLPIDATSLAFFKLMLEADQLCTGLPAPIHDFLSEVLRISVIEPQGSCQFDYDKHIKSFHTFAMESNVPLRSDAFFLVY